MEQRASKRTIVLTQFACSTTTQNRIFYSDVTGLFEQLIQRDNAVVHTRLVARYLARNEEFFTVIIGSISFLKYQNKTGIIQDYSTWRDSCPVCRYDSKTVVFLLVLLVNYKSRLKYKVWLKYSVNFSVFCVAKKLQITSNCDFLCMFLKKISLCLRKLLCVRHFICQFYILK